jgi:lysozyme
MNEHLSTGLDGHELNHYYEACKLRAYPDPGSPLYKALQAARIDPYNLATVPPQFAHLSGKPWTIAWGDTESVTVGMVINQAEADGRYAKRLVRDFEPAARRAVQVPVNQRQWDAIVSTVSNTGPGGGGRDGIFCLADGRPSTFLRKLNLGDYSGAAAELPKWVRAGGQVMKGLQRRREATRLVFLGMDARSAIVSAEAKFP